MAWDFTADSDIQRSMAQTIKEKSESLDGEFSKLYGEIGNLGTHWVGEDYDLFSSGCDGYKTALGDLTTSMDMYAGHFEKIATGTDELATTLIAIVENMTTRFGAGGGATTPGTTTPGTTTPGTTTPGTTTPGTTTPGTTTPGTTPGTKPPLPSNGTQPGNNTNSNGKYEAVIFDDGYGTGGPGNTNPENGVTDPAAQAGTATEEQGYWGKLGQRYVDDWNDLTTDFTAAWEGTDGLFSGAWSCVETVLDGGAFVVSGAADTVQGATDIVQTAWNWCFDLGDDRSVQNGSYWQNVGQDYAENWDYSNCDSLGEYVGTFVCDSVVGSVLDTVQLVGNAGVDVVNGAVEVVDVVVEGATDFVGWLGDLIFG